MQIKDEKPDQGLEEHIPEFLEDRDKDLAGLREALNKGDFEFIRKMAHNWKGFSRPFGFLQLEKIAIQLENAAKDSDQKTCVQLTQQAAFYLQEKRRLSNT